MRTAPPDRMLQHLCIKLLINSCTVLIQCSALDRLFDPEAQSLCMCAGMMWSSRMCTLALGPIPQCCRAFRCAYQQVSAIIFVCACAVLLAVAKVQAVRLMFMPGNLGMGVP